MCTDYKLASISNKLKALLAIAEQVQIDGKRVTPEFVQQARAEGATDLDIHDTVLIAAAFCMYNRYEDGLATWQPRDDEMYIRWGSAWQSKAITVKPRDLLSWPETGPKHAMPPASAVAIRKFAASCIGTNWSHRPSDEVQHVSIRCWETGG